MLPPCYPGLKAVSDALTPSELHHVELSLIHKKYFIMSHTSPQLNYPPL
uniref:Uncharacterized protein n=1 Tax=Anguilla anguilla TaxID=7936 RepID=A0A0E9UIT1_ANGAN